MIFITSSSKRAIEDHFDRHFELEYRLQEQGRNTLLDMIRHISPQGIQFSYVRQDKPLGLGHALLCAQHVVGDDPFAVLLADDLCFFRVFRSIVPLIKTAGLSLPIRVGALGGNSC